MRITSIPVAPIHCALCRATVVRAAEAAGAEVLTAGIGTAELVVATEDTAVLAAATTAVAAVSHEG